MKRVFIAVNVPQHIKILLAKTLLQLQDIYRQKSVRFVDSGDLHITLHFLGDQDDMAIKQIITIIDNAVLHYKKHSAVLGSFGFFPDKNQPRVLWVGAEEVGGNTLVHLQKHLGKELEKNDFIVDRRSWHPHITLGRIVKRIDTNILQTISMPFAEFEVTSIELMESMRDFEATKYKIIHNAKLQS